MPDCRILIGGDIMPGGLCHYQNNFLMCNAQDFIHQFDFAVGTLKCPIVNDIKPDTSKPNIIWAKKEDKDILKALKIKVVSLASSHILDGGIEGLRETKEHLDSMGICHCGAGTNLEEATRPAIVNCGKHKIGFLGYAMDHKSVGKLQFATANTPGLAPFDIPGCLDQIRKCKQECDYVFVVVQWGTEFAYCPDEYQKQESRLMVKAGADGIFGAHAHVPQPSVKYKGKLIAYNLGNFFFPDFVCSESLPVIYPPTPVHGLARSERYSSDLGEPFIRVWPSISRITKVISVDIGPGKINFEEFFMTIVR